MRKLLLAGLLLSSAFILLGANKPDGPQPGPGGNPCLACPCVCPAFHAHGCKVGCNHRRK
jgi:hypothetical protein